MSVPQDETRSARKHRAILDAATEVFLADGYAGTTIDRIAATAAVSKPTVYKHFADKPALFAAIVARTVDEAAEPVHAEVAALRDTGDVAADLRDLARRQLSMVMRPRLLRLRRLVIGEAGRFPSWAGCSPSAARPAPWPTSRRRSAGSPSAACSPSTTPTSRRRTSTGW